MHSREDLRATENGEHRAGRVVENLRDSDLAHRRREHLIAGSVVVTSWPSKKDFVGSDKGIRPDVSNHNIMTTSFWKAKCQR